MFVFLVSSSMRCVKCNKPRKESQNGLCGACRGYLRTLALYRGVYQENNTTEGNPELPSTRQVMVIARRKWVLACVYEDSRWERLRAVYDYVNARWTLAKMDAQAESWRALTHRLEEMFLNGFRATEYGCREEVAPYVPPAKVPVSTWDDDLEELDLD